MAASGGVRPVVQPIAEVGASRRDAPGGPSGEEEAADRENDAMAVG